MIRVATLSPESMMDGENAENATSLPIRAGDQLREARVALKLELSEVAARTRIPLRHLEAIETSNYSALPSPTYAIGFARAYARAIGANEVAIAQQLRGELAVNYERAAPREVYNTEDPSRVPSSGLAWIGAIVTVVLLIGVGLWYGTDLFRSGSAADPAPAPTQTAAPAVQPSAAPIPVTGGHVTLTATDEVWVRVYDGSRNTLFEKTMAAGERYDVPDDAQAPMINVGRPEMLQVAINGSNVPPLGKPGIPVKDIGISAAALQARGAAPTPAPSATPVTATPARRAAPRRPASDVPPAFRDPIAPDAPATGNQL